MTYQPIEHYGMIGDMHTVALVSIEGSIDWLCMPHFDSPSIFAKLLDDQKGGHFVFRSQDDGVTHRQFYWPETNVLVTRFLAPNGAAELTDFMPVDGAAGSVRRQVVRRLTVVRGSIAFQMECRPAFNYARDAHQTELVNGGAVFSSEPEKSGSSPGARPATANGVR
ncbi:MAG: trehalase-like domain-containing protein [Pseudomonadota bacterium]